MVRDYSEGSHTSKVLLDGPFDGKALELNHCVVLLCTSQTFRTASDKADVAIHVFLDKGKSDAV